jgi:hypothetical protein
MYKYKTITNLAFKKLYFGTNELKWLSLFKILGSFIFIIVLSIIFVLPLHSSFLSIQHRKKMLRKEIKRKIIAGLEEAELVKLKFANADLNKKLKWKHSKEFEFNGEMYDIVSSKKTADSTEYLCWWDAEESILNQKLLALVSKKIPDLPGNRELSFQLTNFYKTFYFGDLTVFNKIRNQRIVNCFTANCFVSESDKLISGFQKINSPPPKI